MFKLNKFNYYFFYLPNFSMVKLKIFSALKILSVLDVVVGSPVEVPLAMLKLR